MIEIKFMQKIKVKFKYMGPAPMLKYAKSGDAGVDLTATSKSFDDNGNIVYGTNICMEIPEGYVGLIFPRSSISKKTLIMTNCVGVIDSGYRGEIQFKFKRTQQEIGHIFDYNIGDRIGQLIILPYPHVEFEKVEELSSTERGNQGWGSTGN